MSRGQREDSRTAEEMRTAGGVEDSGRSGGQQLRTSGDIKKGSIHYLKGLSLLKNVVLYSI